MSQLSATTVLLRIANSNVGESATTVGVVGHRRQRQAPRHLHADLAAPTQIAKSRRDKKARSAYPLIIAASERHAESAACQHFIGSVSPPFPRGHMHATRGDQRGAGVRAQRATGDIHWFGIHNDALSTARISTEAAT